MTAPHLFTPGPTPIPERILKAAAQPIIHHRSEDYSEILAFCRPRLQKLFGTKQEVMTLTCSGTGGMEAGFRSVLNSKDRVCVVNAGKFGERFAKLAESYKVACDQIKLPWGSAISIPDLENNFTSHHTALLMQYSETSTGTEHPLPEVATWLKAKFPNALLIVDAITSIGAQEFLMDDWGVDVAVTGSQKAFMLPPGLAFVSLSARAEARMKSADLPGFYFDLRRDLEMIRKNQSSFTPAISLVVALRESLTMLEEEGFQNVFKRHLNLAEFTRKNVQEMKLRLASARPGVACTAAYFPEGVDGKKFLKEIKRKHHIQIAGAQDAWEGKVLRISHLGYYSQVDLEHCLKILASEIRHEI